MLEKSDKILDYFSNYYENAKAYKWHLPPAEELDRVCRKLNLRALRGQRALDFGCGEGRNTRYLCDLGYSVVAVDVVDSAIDLTRQRLDHRQASVQKVTLGTKLPFDDLEFSIIVAYHVLQWLGNKESFIFYLKEFTRLIEEKGTIIFTMPTEDHFHTATGIEIGESVYKVTTEQRRDCVQYSPNLPTLRQHLDKMGLTTSLFGRHEFGYDGDENTADCRLSMYLFCVKLKQ